MNQKSIWLQNRLEQLVRRNNHSASECIFFKFAYLVYLQASSKNSSLCLLPFPESPYSTNFRWLPTTNHTQICQTRLPMESEQNPSNPIFRDNIQKLFKNHELSETKAKLNDISRCHTLTRASISKKSQHKQSEIKMDIFPSACAISQVFI